MSNPSSSNQTLEDFTSSLPLNSSNLGVDDTIPSEHTTGGNGIKQNTFQSTNSHLILTNNLNPATTITNTASHQHQQEQEMLSNFAIPNPPISTQQSSIAIDHHDSNNGLINNNNSSFGGNGSGGNDNDGIDSPRTLWMGDLDPWLDENAITDLWWQILNKHVSVKIIKPKTSKPDSNYLGLSHSGYCFVEFENFDDAQHALSLNGQLLPDIAMPSQQQLPKNPDNQKKYFRLNWASGATLSAPIIQTPEFSLFVGDLSASTTEAHLLAFFQKKYPNSIKTVRVMTDPVSGKSRCFGFVRFTDDLERQLALVEMNGAWFGGRPLRVALATPRNNANNNSNNNINNNHNNNINNRNYTNNNNYNINDSHLLGGGNGGYSTYPPRNQHQQQNYRQDHQQNYFNNKISDHQEPMFLPPPPPGMGNSPYAFYGGLPPPMHTPPPPPIPGVGIPIDTSGGRNTPIGGRTIDDNGNNIDNNSNIQSYDMTPNSQQPNQKFQNPNTPGSYKNIIGTPGSNNQPIQSPNLQAFNNNNYFNNYNNNNNDNMNNNDRNRGGGSSSGNGQPFTDPNNTTVFVGGLSSEVTEQTLFTLFKPFGIIQQVKIPLGKNCGFIKYSIREEAEEAISSMQGFIISGNRIRLSWGRVSTNNKKFQEQQQQVAQAAQIQATAALSMGMDPASAIAAATAAAVGGFPRHHHAPPPPPPPPLLAPHHHHHPFSGIPPPPLPIHQGQGSPNPTNSIQSPYSTRSNRESIANTSQENNDSFENSTNVPGSGSGIVGDSNGNFLPQIPPPHTHAFPHQMGVEGNGNPYYYPPPSSKYGMYPGNFTPSQPDSEFINSMANMNLGDGGDSNKDNRLGSTDDGNSSVEGGGINQQQQQQQIQQNMFIPPIYNGGYPVQDYQHFIPQIPVEYMYQYQHQHPIPQHEPHPDQEEHQQQHQQQEQQSNIDKSSTNNESNDNKHSENDD